jgi:MFS family permease
MPDPLVYLKAMGAAAVVSALIALAMSAARRALSTTWLNAACVAAIVCGLAVGYWALSPRLAWPPTNALDRFLMLVLPVALGIELVAGLDRVPLWIGWLFRISLAAAIPRILLHGSVYLNAEYSDWKPWQAGVVLVVCGALLAGVWALLSWLQQRSPGISLPFALQATTLCSGLTVMMAGYIKGGAAAFPLTATLVATSLVTWALAQRLGVPKSFAAPAIIGASVVGLFGLLLIGRFFGQLSTGVALALLLAPLLCWTTELLPLRSKKPWFVGSVRLALVVIPLMVVLLLAKREFDRKMGPLLGEVRQGRVDPTAVVVSSLNAVRNNVLTISVRVLNSHARCCDRRADLDRHPWHLLPLAAGSETRQTLCK